MRHLQAVVLALATGVVGCCSTGKSAPAVPSPTVVGRPTEAPCGEFVYIDVALIEQPCGDRFVNEELWERGDEQGVSLDVKPLLEENGLRICQLGGLLPAPLQALLSSPRSCPNPRRLRGEPGKATAVLIGPPREHCSFQFTAGAASRRVALERAQSLLEATPTLEGEHHVRLRFTPHIHHGNTRLQPRVEKDPGGPLRWAVEAREQDEEFPQVAWECTLGANEYAVVGPRVDRPDTLGWCFFLPEGAPVRRQWLLVLRALRAPLDSTVDEALSQAPPIAMQAGWTSVRGTSR